MDLMSKRNYWGWRRVADFLIFIFHKFAKTPRSDGRYSYRKLFTFFNKIITKYCISINKILILIIFVHIFISML